MEERAMRLCISACLRKPFDEETLLGAIRTAMKSTSREKDKGSGIDRKGTC
jgi:FixJ family two-component response regulator